MAEAVLALDAPKKVTLENTATNLRRVVLPKGTRNLEISSDGAIYVEPDTGQADGGAGTAASQWRITAGTGSWRPFGAGRGAQRLREDTAIFIAGSSSAQVIWLCATDRGE